MEVRTAIPLDKYTTMKLGGKARFMAPATSVEDVVTIYQNAEKQGLPVFVLGSGSNVVAHDDGFPGIVLLNRIKGVEVLSDDQVTCTIKVGAGENWDEFVDRTVEMMLSGVEAMSGIPGTVGASPVQNVGAYGQEVADTFVSLEAFDSQTNQVVTMTAEDCKFSYRNSIFRDGAKGRYCILSVTFRLHHTTPKPPFYTALQNYLDKNSITIYTPQNIRDAVLAIRKEKLPDPAERPNSGSFFKNAVIEKWQYEDLKSQYVDMPSFDMPGNKYKIPTGWLIEKAGLKGQLLHGMRVHDKNTLVLINESANSYADLEAARNEIIQAVYDKFRIQIQQEPLEI
ncbi:UDP-N-acetylenolpyruvoylglucosamine reductase [Candidatus Saccharibacteria bacterium]|nr:MAG: UDP-N-acetylenolpyruvoylglucosamine reductase [Candidatus Saccharibacteria bacterium]